MVGSKRSATARWAWAGVVATLFMTTGWGLAASRGVGAQEAATLIEENRGKESFVLLDLRTPKEFAEERIDGARLVDFLAPSFRDEVAKLDPEKTYLVYCRSGNRSGKALAVFADLGFHDVIHLSTGILGWKEAGLATVADGR